MAFSSPGAPAGSGLLFLCLVSLVCLWTAGCGAEVEDSSGSSEPARTSGRDTGVDDDDTADEATDDASDDDITQGAGSDEGGQDDSVPVADDPTDLPPSSPSTEEPCSCPVPASCQPCPDKTCARAEVSCNADGSCGGVEFTCPPEAGHAEASDCEEPGRKYVSRFEEDCDRADFACGGGTTAFFDDCGCGCKEAIEPAGCGPGTSQCGDVCVNLLSNPLHCGACGAACATGNSCAAGTCALVDGCDDPSRRYVAESVEECAAIRFACEDGQVAFSDACGCGCLSDGDRCSVVENAIVEQWAKLAGCRSDDDCEIVENGLCGVSSDTLGSVGCYLPANVDADFQPLNELQAEAAACGLQSADCDCVPAPVAVCVDGQCRAESEESLCESTGGAWDTGSCGHYECGQMPPCKALIPGCDCGHTAGFVAGEGCVEDTACLGIPL